MTREPLVMTVLLMGLLAIAVASDIRRHRIPNLLILVGLGLGLAGQAYSIGVSGFGYGLLGGLIAFAIFLPMYALGGMAAGDVKLMAMVGAFLPLNGALNAALLSLIAGCLCGLLLILVRGQLPMTLSRYWLMLRAQAYFAPEADEVAGKPFPYAVAILLGTLVSLFWQPLAFSLGG
ncbi:MULTISPECIES: prepilin peptidase [unclassified Pseudomonas]|uniref:A24 family peptidase n=1 Tax=Pseudomonas TaxID=286 RepID=UPI000A1DEBFF|nr:MULTISPECIES: prepilin peptidase [unclassified Pseudomonas]